MLQHNNWHQLPSGQFHFYFFSSLMKIHLSHILEFLFGYFSVRQEKAANYIKYCLKKKANNNFFFFLPSSLLGLKSVESTLANSSASSKIWKIIFADIMVSHAMELLHHSSRIHDMFVPS